jgi:hypothetical protein
MPCTRLPWRLDPHELGEPWSGAGGHGPIPITTLKLGALSSNTAEVHLSSGGALEPSRGPDVVVQQLSWVDPEPSSPSLLVHSSICLSPGERASARGFFFHQLRLR